MMSTGARIIENFRILKRDHGVNALIVSLFAVFLGIALQIQTDIAGMRINMADIAMPFVGLAVGACLIGKRSFWPQWNIPYAYLFMAVLAVWMAASFVNGYFYIGEISGWALYNKLLGFFVLLAYFALGGWMFSNYRDVALSAFVKVFCGFFVFVLIAGVVFIVSKYMSFSSLPRVFPFEGIMANRNAFCVLMIAAIVFVLVIARRMEKFFPVWLIPSFMLCLPLMMAYNSSRAGLIILACLGVYFLIADFKWFSKHVLSWFLTGSVLAGLFLSAFDTPVENRYYIKRVTNAVTMLKQDGNTALDSIKKDKIEVRKLVSELVRMRNFRDSMTLWKDSLLMGAGLGALLHYQYQNYDPETTFIDIMDSSPVWLLAETGLIGLGLFMAFYVFILRALWIKKRDAKGLEAVFAEALFIFLLAFGAMSLLHEIIYTRFLWLMMGVGTAVYRK